MKVLVVPDKFKGTLTARDAAEAIADGWRSVRARDEVELLPMSDGGDGFGEVLGGIVEAEVYRTLTVNAAHEPVEAHWWFRRDEQLAIIESAKVIGLALLPPGKFHPFELDTFGLGAVLRDAAVAGARTCIVGIGGSATNDGGFGMARALGWEFFGEDDKVIERWTGLNELERIEAPAETPSFAEIAIAVDVQNPLLGPAGASRIYGPQKGLRPEDMGAAESCLARMADVVLRQFGCEAAKAPGAGAAGGLGFGLSCFLRAQLTSGFELFARHARLRDRIAAANLVITGEGAIDAQTAMGKGVGGVAMLCRERGVPCIGIAGQILVDASESPFSATFGIVPELANADEGKRQARRFVEELARRAATATSNSAACHATNH